MPQDTAASAPLASRVAAVGAAAFSLASELRQIDALASILAGDYGVGTVDPSRDAAVHAWATAAEPALAWTTAELGQIRGRLVSAL